MDYNRMSKPRLHGTPAKSWQKLKDRARGFRKQSTPAEETLWQRLRGSALGEKFRRQHAVDSYIVDFVCLERCLIVEVDGGIHDELQPRDQQRDAHLIARGYRVMRIKNEDVLRGMDQVLDRILAALREA